MPEHLIRLRGGWTLKTVEGETRQTLPSADLTPHPAGFVLLRHFHAPSALTPGETVHLRLEHIPGVARVLLNDRVVGDGPSLDGGRRQIDVTGAIVGRCLLRLEVGPGEWSTPSQGWGHVALVIESDESIGEP